MRFIRSLIYLCGILFVICTVLPAVVAFLIPALGGLGIVLLVIGSIWFVGRLIVKGGGN
jgi:uncharacterized membrane protein